ncbi:MAG: hypothetical protein ABIL25_04580 [candidate division WOR-3 bacterium]
MTSGCIRVSGASDRWQTVEPRPSDTPFDPLQLILDVPEFLGMLDASQGTPRAAIIAPGSASNRVLVAVDAAGAVQLVACPADDTELSSIVGDLLAAGGRFWRQPYETLAKAFDEALGCSLVERLSARVGKEWNVGAFRSGIERSLSLGRFPIVLVVRARTKQVEDTLSYLAGMNIQVRVLSYTYCASNGVELVRPVLLDPKPGTAADHTVEAAQRTIIVERHTEPAPPSARHEAAAEHEPFILSKASPQQQEILNRLAGLDDLKLVRRGNEYLLPLPGGRFKPEATITLAVDPNRWPFPQPDEVIVVVNISQDHLAGYLKVTPQEIRDFLSSLPRVERKEHKGCVLLRAAGVGEALQLVNELKALKEVSFGGIG